MQLTYFRFLTQAPLHRLAISTSISWDLLRCMEDSWNDPWTEVFSFNCTTSVLGTLHYIRILIFPFSFLKFKSKQDVISRNFALSLKRSFEQRISSSWTRTDPPTLVSNHNLESLMITHSTLASSCPFPPPHHHRRHPLAIQLWDGAQPSGNRLSDW